MTSVVTCAHVSVVPYGQPLLCLHAKTCVALSCAEKKKAGHVLVQCWQILRTLAISESRVESPQNAGHICDAVIASWYPKCGVIFGRQTKLRDVRRPKRSSRTQFCLSDCNAATLDCH